MIPAGACPLTSEEILLFALRGLRERGAFDELPEEMYRGEAEKLAERLPSRYFPDVYMDLPLTGGAFEGMAAVFDCYDRCLLNDRTEGRFFSNLSIPAATEPADRDTLLVLHADGSSETIEQSSLTPAAEEPLIAELAEHKVLFRKEAREDGYRLTFTTGPSKPRRNYRKKAVREQIRRILRAAGCSEKALELPDLAAYNCGVPCLDPARGYMQWLVCIDIAAFRLTVRDGRVTDCRAVIRISDRSETFSGLVLKPTQAYQWHITDNCDQRCKHCYLFAEDARMKCVSTPWDQLMHTLDEITADAEARYAYPMPVISGGDPILHPRFWDFAEELHRRGLRWIILGNPFHLDEAVCKRLYELGCFKYQLSMDGLREFHDYMRKPGSWQATLDALELLNGAKIQTQLMATVSRQNLDDVIACMDIAAEHHAGFFTFARYCATSPEKVQETYPSPQEYRAFLLRYYEKRRAYGEQGCSTVFQLKEHLFTLLRYELGEFVIPEYARENPDRVFDGCHLARSCAILANGDVEACRRMESVIGNIRETSLRDILCSDLCRQYAEVREIKKCKDCELLNFCRGCRAVGYNATGDLQAADPMCWKEEKRI